MVMEKQQNEDSKGKIDEKCDPALLCLPCLSTWSYLELNPRLWGKKTILSAITLATKLLG